MIPIIKVPPGAPLGRVPLEIFNVRFFLRSHVNVGIILKNVTHKDRHLEIKEIAMKVL